jgi:hypothetical protein
MIITKLASPIILFVVIIFMCLIHHNKSFIQFKVRVQNKSDLTDLKMFAFLSIFQKQKALGGKNVIFFHFNFKSFDTFAKNVISWH